VIVGIARGGLVPAVLLSDELLLKNFLIIRLERYWLGKRKAAKAIKITQSLPGSLRGKKVLLVDDITDHGGSLARAKEVLEKLHPAELRTAVLEHKVISIFKPDYCAHTIRKWRWIVYPWTRQETLADLARRVAGKKTSPAVIVRRLHERFGLRVTPHEVERALGK